jgi:hypothetical protein
MVVDMFCCVLEVGSFLSGDWMVGDFGRFSEHHLA